MTDEPDASPLESRLLFELTQIERSLGELMRERDCLLRILSRVRHEKIVKVDITRKNSFSRIVVEHTVIQTLEKSAKPVTTHRLLSEAKSAVYGLKDSTFRSYLSRMKSRSLVVSSGLGHWTLPVAERKN